MAAAGSAAYPKRCDRAAGSGVRMKTSLVIATHRRPAMIERLLRNLATCTFPPDVEVRLVENGPKCGVEAIAAANDLGGRVRYHYREQGMKSLALNHAIAASDADLIIFFDDDITLPAEIVQTYVEAALRLGPGHFFGGGLTALAETPCPAHLVPYLPRSASGWCYADRETAIPAGEFDFFFGANWAAFRTDLLAAGLFARDLGIGASRYSSVGEEEELQKRLTAKGLTPVYLAHADVGHPVPAECYTEAWLRRRRFRLGVMDWMVNHSPARGRTFLGAPVWMVRRLIAEQARAVVALGTSSPAPRIDHAMEAAHYTGLIYGAVLEKRRSADAGKAFAAAGA